MQTWTVGDGKPLKTLEPPRDCRTSHPRGWAARRWPDLAWGVIGRNRLVWDATTGKLLALPIHTSGIKASPSAAGKEVLTAGLDGKLMRWDAATGKPDRRGQAPNGPRASSLDSFTRTARGRCPASYPAAVRPFRRDRSAVVRAGCPLGPMRPPHSTDMRTALVVSASRDEIAEVRRLDLVSQKKLTEVGCQAAVMERALPQLARPATGS